MVVSGFSFALKKFLFKKEKEIEINNIDILYGFFFLIFLSLFLNFFFPLKYFLILIFFIGSYYFYVSLIKKINKINYVLHFIILFCISAIVYRNGDNVDTPMYHLQIIKWLYNEKIVFGLSNLEIRFGSNSLWFSLLSLLQIKFKNFNSIYILNVIPFSIFFYQTLFFQKRLSYIFLCLSLTFILLFSFLHPFMNGVILNHLHNTEVDTVGMVFFILSFYSFLKFFEKKSIENLRILIICSVICMVIKLSYIGVVFLPLIAMYKFYKKNLFALFSEKTNFIVILLIFGWLIKNFIISGCYIFPISFLCFEVSWSPGLEEIQNYSNVVKGFARDTRDRLMYSNFQHTIYSYDWFIPWFKDYALNNAFLKIFFIIIFVSMLALIIMKYFNLFDDFISKKKNDYLIFCIVILPSFIIWFNAPETRFGWGSMISFSCLILSISIYHLKYLKKLSFLIIQNSSIIIIIFLLLDNKSSLSLKNFWNPYIKNIDYSKIIKIGSYNNYEVYRSTNWKCYDYKKICVNTPKKDYRIYKKNGYLFFLYT